MKSWGERLVTGLKNWRSRKGKAEPEQPLDVGSSEQLNQESIEEPLIKVTAIDRDKKDSGLNQNTDPANACPDVQMTGDGGEPNMLERASDQPEHTGRGSIKPSTPISRLKSPGKQSGARTLKHGGQPTISKELTAQYGASADEAFDKERLISDGPRGPNGELPKQVTERVRSKDSGEASGKSVIQTGAKSRSNRSVAILKVPQTEEATNENATNLVVPALPQKYSRKRKLKTAAEGVTDAELAALEAENVRLKLLLREKLSAKQDNTEN